jgi:hypothetical protein
LTLAHLFLLASSINFSKVLFWNRSDQFLTELELVVPTSRADEVRTLHVDDVREDAPPELPTSFCPCKTIVSSSTHAAPLDYLSMKRSIGSNDGNRRERQQPIEGRGISLNPQRVSTVMQQHPLKSDDNEMQQLPLNSDDNEIKPNAKEPSETEGMEDEDDSLDAESDSDIESHSDEDDADGSDERELAGEEVEPIDPTSTPAQAPVAASVGVDTTTGSEMGFRKKGKEIKISTPARLDVLFGRGKPYQSHFGNIRLHKFVKRQKERYTTARRHEKLTIATEVVRSIKFAGQEPARFLKRSTEGDYWVEVSDFVARQKVGHALRGKPRGKKKGTRSLSSRQTTLPIASDDDDDDPRPTEALSNPSVPPARDHPETVGRPSSGMIPVATGPTMTGTWHQSGIFHAPPPAMNEMEERHHLLTQIAALNTETLADIVRQHCAPVGIRRRSLASLPPMAASGIPHGAAAFGLPIHFMNSSLPPSFPWAAAGLASRWSQPGHLPPGHYPLPQAAAGSSSHGDMPPPDHQLVAAFLQQNGLMQGHVPGGGGGGEQERHPNDPRVLAAAFLQQQGRFPPYF